MPNRILSGSLATSDSLSRVSLEAEVAFLHLVSVADDFGRFDGRPAVLLAALFPTRMETISIEVLSRWLRELEAENLIRWYVVDGRRFVLLPGWGKYQRGPRAQRSKYPEPPAEATQAAAPAADPASPADNPRSDARNPRSNDREPLTNAPVFSEGVGVVVGEGDKEPPRKRGARSHSNSGEKPPPEALSELERMRLDRWAADNGLEPAAVDHAIKAVLGWGRAGNKRKADWVQTIMNAIHRGWALDGYNGRDAPQRGPLTANERTKLELLHRRQADGVWLPGDPPLPGRAQPAARAVSALVTRLAADGRRDD